MKRALRFGSAVAVVVATHLPAAQITTLLVGGGDARNATLSARRIDGAAAGIERAVSVPGTAELALPAGLWELRVIGDGLWAPPIQIRDSASAAMKAWPTVAVTGTSSNVNALRVQFTPLDPNGPSGEVDCAAAGASWTCSIPAGEYDLRFASRGSAPEFRWRVSVAADQKPLRLDFVPGASLAGRVEAARGARISIEGTEVALVPSGDESGSARQSIRTDAKGFFQFKGLSPGDYTVHAAKKGASAKSESVKLLAGVAAELNAPLLLDTPKRLLVTVMPRVDPAGRPWRVRLSWTDKRLRRGDVLSESQVSAAGEWTHPALGSGDYTVEVMTDAGERWKSEPVAIGRDDVTLPIAALAEPIAGTVTLGERPLQAALSFGGEGGPQLQSDADGHFSGFIAPADDEERVILIEADTPRVKRTVRAKLHRAESGKLQLLIHLPATTVMGRVLNDDRSPVTHAIVTVTSDHPDTFEQTFTETDGSFQIDGYEPGAYRVTADAFERSSKSLSVELSQEKPAEVELILEGLERVQGRITAGEAPAIAGEIYGFPRDGWTPMMPRAVSDGHGRFELDFPPGTKTFDFLAVHPAFDLLIGRATIVKEKTFSIRMTQLGGTLIVDSKSKPTDLVVVRNAGEIAATMLADAAGGMVAPGRITIPRLVPSHYFVCTRDRKKCVSGDLAPHGTLTLSLDAD